MRRVLNSLPRRPGTWFMLLILTAAVLFYLMPVYVMVVTGMKEANNVSLSTMWQLPRTLQFGGFAQAWPRLSPYLLNSFKMVIPSVVLSCLLGSINGFLFSKYKFRGSDLLLLLMLFGMFVPYQTILIPMVRLLQMLGVYGKVSGLVLVHVVYGLPFTTLMFRNFYANIPDALLESARIDGAGMWGIFRRIILPLSAPGFVVAGIFQFTNIWNDFLFAVTVVPNPQAQPVMVALNNLSGSFSVDWNVVMAGAVLAGLPTAILYIVMGKYFVRGLLAGSVKG